MVLPIFAPTRGPWYSYSRMKRPWFPSTPPTSRVQLVISDPRSCVFGSYNANVIRANGRVMYTFLGLFSFTPSTHAVSRGDGGKQFEYVLQARVSREESWQN